MKLFFTGSYMVLLFYGMISCDVYAQKIPNPNPLYLSILKRSAGYSAAKTAMPSFVYQSSNDDPALPSIRQRLKLDSIGGFGNEVSRLINIMHWVHNSIRHDGTTETGIVNFNANSILQIVKEKRIGIACGELATVLNDCYLAMGWAARKVYCFPLLSD